MLSVSGVFIFFRFFCLVYWCFCLGGSCFFNVLVFGVYFVILIFMWKIFVKMRVDDKCKYSFYRFRFEDCVVYGYGRYVFRKKKWDWSLDVIRMRGGEKDGYIAIRRYFCCSYLGGGCVFLFSGCFFLSVKFRRWGVLVFLGCLVLVKEEIC